MPLPVVHPLLLMVLSISGVKMEIFMQLIRMDQHAGLTQPVPILIPLHQA